MTDTFDAFVFDEKGWRGANVGVQQCSQIAAKWAW